jgi:hypothetical protein
VAVRATNANLLTFQVVAQRSNTNLNFSKMSTASGNKRGRDAMMVDEGNYTTTENSGSDANPSPLKKT